MRNNPYHKNLKDHLPLFMQGPSVISALIANEEQKNIVGKAMTIPKKTYIIQNVSFAMISPPVLNEDLTANPPDILKTEMGQTEVTQELFQAVMGWNDSGNQSSPQNPVEEVNWYDCVSFCNKLSNLLGFEECYEISGTSMAFGHTVADRVTWDASKNGFRLPTEKEWEFFARAGTDNEWSGTNDENELEQYAWYEDNSRGKTHPVGEKLPNEWGLYDMAGNVEEWCWDLYGSEDDLYDPEDDLYDPEDDSYDDTDYAERVLRGGGCLHYAGGCRVAYRSRNDADLPINDRGFRLCRSLG